MEKNDAPAPEKPSAAANSGESGWTDYLEDFSSSDQIEREKSFLCSSIGSCSWGISDANTNNALISPLCSVGEVLDSPRKLISFKKTRTQKIFEDDSLEDTATSPVHSPKVADLKVRASHVNPRFDDDMMISSSTGSGRVLENDYSKREKGVYQAAGGDLKERELCLFPFSMLLHYQG